ncbi:Squalene synthase [Labilithrix luteola]|uniref:Squalene synthase n=2 Tax=Labilithrix luteola TaxID=1391654 RepID=A0A0K1PLD7_9BACT|nr:Squalene synthase [Labilithrix luteola]
MDAKSEYGAPMTTDVTPDLELRSAGVVRAARDRYQCGMTMNVETETSALTQDEIASLLAKTSRTFALTIPLLPEPLTTQVGIAYLLLRIADTLEDAPRWGRDRRHEALVSFASWLGGRSSSTSEARRWISLVEKDAPIDDAGCMQLLRRSEGVRASLDAMEPRAARAVRDDVIRTTRKMAEFVARQSDDGAMQLDDVPDLEAYCYAVAGIVGELLTVLFAIATPSVENERPSLMALAQWFGEGLQLVNILKDANADAKEGRLYLPRNVPRAEIMQKARADLAKAQDYTALLSKASAPPGARRFCELPVRLAVATLDRLEAGEAKLPRDEVLRIFAEVTSS